MGGIVRDERIAIKLAGAVWRVDGQHGVWLSSQDAAYLCELLDKTYGDRSFANELNRALNAASLEAHDPPSPPPSTSATNEPPRDGVGG